MSTAIELPARMAQEPATDRRRSLREPYVIEAWISSPTATDPEDRIEATAVNISKHGLAFNVEKPLATAAFFVIDFGLGPQRVVTEIRTISCRKDDNGMFEVGAEFC